MPVEQHVEQVVHVPVVLGPKRTRLILKIATSACSGFQTSSPTGSQTNLHVLVVLAAKVNKVERVEHNPVELTVEVPRPVVIEKTIEAFAAFATVFVLYSSYLSMFCTRNLHQNVLL